MHRTRPPTDTELQYVDLTAPTVAAGKKMSGTLLCIEINFFEYTEIDFQFISYDNPFILVE